MEDTAIDAGDFDAANPANPITDPKLLDQDLPVMPKLELGRDGWLQAVGELIRAAPCCRFERGTYMRWDDDEQRPWQ